MQRVTRVAEAKKLKPQWLRVDWVEYCERATWCELQKRLQETKRNYFRYGLSLDPSFEHAFLETELNGNAMLYGGGTISHAVLNTNNFRRYAALRHKLTTLEFPEDGEVHVFSSRGVFASTGSTDVHLLQGAGRDAGRREIQQLTPRHVRELISNGSNYLASQVGEDGIFHYGWHPCFDRPINSYNSLRHASTVYAMLEAWEVTREPQLKSAIDRALDRLTTSLITTVRAENKLLSFLVEENSEIKLGGNAVCLLALVKYSELTGTEEYLPLLERLAEGILYMQDKDTGQFSHVLVFPSLAVKEQFRIIYYDGEAAFGLMRLYGLTADARWIAAVEKAFQYFIAKQHWKAHDHWLAYCVNELTRYKPNADYYRFGIQNFVDHLNFVIERVTTFPTLLELMMAAQKMIARLEVDANNRDILNGLDLGKFYDALHIRAHYLLNGHFWPELAMFFENPERITGSYFIRHHAFRVRIDDVEHYLSGFVAYLDYLESGADQKLLSLAKHRAA
ncbi:hypothetical protein PPNSA23_41560 [Phyllobacterium phragmitis]|uniref:Mur ligase n=2 Tax=Phyllobacterium phragmitis TaxID=2670329 RepID=A0ABQ0H5J9_9HYPH